MAVTRVVVTRWRCRCGLEWSARKAALEHDRADARDAKHPSPWLELAKYAKPVDGPWVIQEIQFEVPRDVIGDKVRRRLRAALRQNPVQHVRRVGGSSTSVGRGRTGKVDPKPRQRARD